MTPAMVFRLIWEPDILDVILRHAKRWFMAVVVQGLGKK